eukprot:scaffold1012_cov189-Alexandrium_tamarense.AAC.1
MEEWKKKLRRSVAEAIGKRNGPLFRLHVTSTNDCDIIIRFELISLGAGGIILEYRKSSTVQRQRLVGSRCPSSSSLKE